ncbi:lysozyme [Myxosarcina sp. GI1]|uniref:lysozyme n=1 Tax=Myxosarcina sp. GI1 TaxID=1541065 RepID=UPI00068CE9F5|nr:lysozyme [Myxosarcina sp. GI1]
MKRYITTTIACSSVCTFGLVSLASAANKLTTEPQRQLERKDIVNIDSTISTNLATITDELPPINFEAPTPVETKKVAINSRTANTNPQPATQISAKTLELIREFEGFRDRAYYDTDGTPVIGYGLSKINGKPVAMGDSISVESAEQALSQQLKVIQKQLDEAVTVELNENQLGALSSIVFNVGEGFIHQSTLIEKLNGGDYHGAANEFLRWDKANVGGSLVQLSGLSRRRQAEKELFLTPANK